jgi:hypothetical protein
MRTLIHHTTRICAALALIALPTLAFAQTPRAATAAQPNPAAEHLAAARSALNNVLTAPAPTGDAYKKLAELKTEYLALERGASTASPDWSTHYNAIERLVTELIGPPSASAEAGAVGTSGRAGARVLDTGVAANLQEFRTHLAAFSALMSAAAPTQPSTAPPSSAPPNSAPPPAAPPSETVAASTSASDAASLVAQVDQVAALVDGLLAVTTQPPSGTVAVDRATLEQIKAQLDQIKLRVRK